MTIKITDVWGLAAIICLIEVGLRLTGFSDWNSIQYCSGVICLAGALTYTAWKR